VTRSSSLSMHRNVALALAVMAAGSVPGAPDSGARPHAAPGTIEVVFVDNEGFLLTMDDRKILVDGLFHLESEDRPSAEIRRATEGGLPPFDHLDLILATHRHVDHFDPQAVVASLRSNPGAVFLGPPQTIEAIRLSAADVGPVDARLLTIEVPVGQGAELEAAGIRIRIMSSGHGGAPETQNYMYLLERSGLKAFHEGDSSVQESLGRWNLSGEDLDVAFFHFARLAGPGGMGSVEEAVGARHFIPMHFTFTSARELASQLEELTRSLPNVHCLRHPLQRIVLPFREPAPHSPESGRRRK